MESQEKKPFSWEEKEGEPERILVLCNPIKWNHPTVKGVIKSNCAVCDEPVWLAPTSVALFEKAAAAGQELHAVCIPCYRIEYEKGREDTFAVLKSQLEELKSNLKQAQAESN